MARSSITKTLGPIHFEDLDPRRFEDLVRELAYDFKDSPLGATSRKQNQEFDQSQEGGDGCVSRRPTQPPDIGWLTPTNRT